MFCTECGTKLNDGALFCTNCGYKIPAEAAIRPAENNVEETVVPVAVPVAQPVKSTKSVHAVTLFKAKTQ